MRGPLSRALVRRRRDGGRHVVNRNVRGVIVEPAVLVKDAAVNRVGSVVGEGEIRRICRAGGCITSSQSAVAQREAVMEAGGGISKTRIERTREACGR